MMVNKKKNIKDKIFAIIKENFIPSLLGYLIPLFIPFLLLLWINENKTLDFRFKLRGEIPGDPRILLIDIDNQSLSLRPPWNLDQLEKLLIPILQRKPAAVGLDLRFYGDPENPTYRGNLQQFVENIASYAVPIVLAVGFPDGQLLKPNIQNKSENVHFGSVTIIDNYYPEADDVVRKVKLLMQAKNEDKPIPAFALQLLSVAKNLTPMQCLSELSAAGLTKSPEDYHLIRYYNNYRFSKTKVYEGNKRIEKFRAIQAKAILNQPFSTEFNNDLDQHVQDSTIVIVGATYQTDTTADWFQIPLSSNKTISGMIVHANILSWLLGEKYIAEPGFFRYFFLTLTLILITWLVIHFFKLNRAMLIIIGVFLLYSLITLFFFMIWEIWLPIVWPLRLSIIFFFILSIKKLKILRMNNG